MKKKKGKKRTAVNHRFILIRNFLLNHPGQYSPEPRGITITNRCQPSNKLVHVAIIADITSIYLLLASEEISP